MGLRSFGLALSLFAGAVFTTGASAAELFAGVAAHDVNVKVALCCFEKGADFQFGARSAPLSRPFGLGELHAYAFGSINDAGGANFAVAGLDVRIPIDGGRFYIQPGLGGAIHDGPGEKFQRTPDRLYFGSRLLFAPELSLGWAPSPRWAAELTFLHLSHAQLGGPQNPGLDDIGLRIVRRLGR